MKKLFTAIRASDLEMVRQIIENAIRASDLEMVRQIIENCSEGSISILFDEVFG